jgi:HEAT repeat protein
MPGQAAPAAVLEKLLAQANHQDPGIRVVALEQLSQYQGDERARRRLMEGLKDPDPDVRSAASGLLGQEPPEEAPEETAPDNDNQ